MIREIQRKATSGGLMLTILLVLTVVALLSIVNGGRTDNPQQVAVSVAGLMVLAILWAGLITVQPNQAKALLLFGEYKGTIKEQGLWWANPFLTKKAVSLRVRNFETTKLKVNDHNSNPIEIAAVVVWQVTDTALRPKASGETDAGVIHR